MFPLLDREEFRARRGLSERLLWPVAARIIVSTFRPAACQTEMFMDLGDITQLALVATTVFVLGRVGWALAHLIERRSSASASLTPETADQLRALEDEQLAIRQQLAELQERQDFTERALLRDDRPQSRPPTPEMLSDRAATPH